MTNIKNIFLSIRNNIQMVGYRDIVETYGRANGLDGFVFNDIDGSVKIMASGPEISISGFINDLTSHRHITIETTVIEEDITLPSPFGRIATEDIREYMKRFDKGIGILTEHSSLFHEIIHILSGMNDKLGALDRMDDKLDGMNDKLGALDRMDDKLGGMNDKLGAPDRIEDKLGGMNDKLGGMDNKLGVLDDISEKLDTLPERIADALKKT
ncbi:MAG: acylphosphatase [Methanosarcinales archaeon]|nr:acylphosphatase [Methanosarcinales archaeon]